MTAKTLVSWPTAKQVPTAGHETPKTLPSKAALVVGPAVAVQVMPFHCSMRGSSFTSFSDPVEPTASTLAGVRARHTDQDRGSRSARCGRDVLVHAMPFQDWATATAPPDEPTAMQKFHAGHETPLSSPTPDGVEKVTGLLLQTLPFHRSAVGVTTPAFASLPTAMQTLRLAHETEASVLLEDPGLVGGDVSCHPAVVSAPAGAGPARSGTPPTTASAINAAATEYRYIGVRRRILPPLPVAPPGKEHRNHFAEPRNSRPSVETTRGTGPGSPWCLRSPARARPITHVQSRSPVCQVCPER